MSEAFGKFRNIPPRVTDDTRARWCEPQATAENLSSNIAKRWHMDETRARIGSAYFEFISTRHGTVL